jgi:hypothetical protein
MRACRRVSRVKKKMMHSRGTSLAGLLVGCLIAGPAWTQTLTNTVPAADRNGRVLGSSPVSSPSSVASGSVRPERPEQQRLPLDLRERLASFEKVREAYLAEQRELIRKLRGATDADRDQIRELIKTRREAWLEQARQFREEARDRLTELKNGALQSHKEALDAARENARDKLKDARDRRGSD